MHCRHRIVQKTQLKLTIYVWNVLYPGRESTTEMLDACSSGFHLNVCFPLSEGGIREIVQREKKRFCVIIHSAWADGLIPPL